MNNVQYRENKNNRVGPIYKYKTEFDCLLLTLSYYPMIKYVNLTIIRIIHINEHTIYVHIDFYNTANGYNGIFFQFHL